MYYRKLTYKVHDMDTIKSHPRFKETMDVMENIIKSERINITLSPGYSSPVCECIDHDDECRCPHYYRDDDAITFGARDMFSFPDVPMIGNDCYVLTNRDRFDAAVAACFHVASTLMPDVCTFEGDDEVEESQLIDKTRLETMINYVVREALST